MSRCLIDRARTANKKSVLLLTVCGLGLAACGGDELLAPEQREVSIEEVLDGAVEITRDPNGSATWTCFRRPAIG